MPLFGRTPAAPTDVVARAGLPAGERVLAAAQAEDGTWVLGTPEAVVLVPDEDAEPGRPTARIPWQEVHAADWSRDDDQLRISEVGEFGQPRPVHALVLREPGRLLTLVRERVTASVLMQRRVVVRDRLGLMVLARRSPQGGPISWAYELDAGLDPDDPEVRAVVDAALQAAAEELGLA